MCTRALPVLTLISLLTWGAGASAQCPDVGSVSAAIDIDADFATHVGLRAPRLRTRADLDAAAQIAARARAAFEGGARADLVADLSAAFDRSGDVDLLGMLGLSLRAAGRAPEAWAALHQFRLEARADVWASLRAEVEAALGELQGQLGGLRLTGDLGAMGQVWLDGRLVSRLPYDGALYLPPGRVTLEVRGFGRIARRIEVDLSAGSAIDVDATLPQVTGDLAAKLGLRLPDLTSRADLDAAGALMGRLSGGFAVGGRAALLGDLRAAWDRSGDVNLLGALGLSLKEAGQLQASWIALHRFRMEADADVWARFRADVEAALGELQGQLGGVRLAGDLGARGQLYLDGELVSQLPIDGAIYLAPGNHELEVRADGRVATRVIANVSAGAMADVSVSLPRIEAALDASMISGLTAGALGSLSASASATASAAFDPIPLVAVFGTVTGVLALLGGITVGVHDAINPNFDDPMFDPATFDTTGTDVAWALEYVGFLGAGLGAAALITVGILAAVLGTAADADLPDCDDLALELPRDPPIELSCNPWLSVGGDGETVGAGCQLRF